MRTVGFALSVVWVAAMIVASPSNGRAQTPHARDSDMPASLRGFFGVEVDRDDYATVERRLGRAGLWVTGQTGDALAWWCYRTRGAPPNTVLLLTNDVEMGGPAREVYQVELYRASAADTLIRRCAILRDSAAGATHGSLRLGMTRGAVIATLGKPTTAWTDSVAYVWDTHQPIPTSDSTYAYWNARRKECFDGHAPVSDISGEAMVRFDASGVMGIRISRNESVCE